MRCRVLGLTLFIVTLATLTNAAIARDRRAVFVQAINCAPTMGPTTDRSIPAAPSSQANRQTTDPRVETLNLAESDGAPFRLCVVCPKDAVVIINGRLTSSTERIRQYEISVPGRMLELDVLVLQDGLEPILNDRMPATAGLSKTVVVPSVVSAELKKLRSTAEALEARKREVDKLQDERDTLQLQRDKLQIERDQLQMRRDQLQKERDAKK